VYSFYKCYVYFLFCLFIFRRSMLVEIYHMENIFTDSGGFFMKKAKLAILLTFALIGMTLLMGCFNPISAVPPNTQEKTTPEGQNEQPFTVDVYVGEQGRSIAGASSVQIKSGLYNFIQLVVLNESNAIVAYDEARKERSDETNVVLKINSIAYGQNYKFLLLFGNWERNYSSEQTNNGVTVYDYNESAKPVLLAAGYKPQLVMESGKVTVTMWPLVINTVFEADAVVQPVIGQSVEILQGAPWAWKAKWTIGQNSIGAGNGLKSLLDAQSLETNLPILAKRFMVDGTEQSSSAGTTSCAIEYPLPDYNAITDIGDTHWVNFNLEYVPFNLTSTAAWTVVASSLYDGVSKFNLAESSPVWIIRNGLSDAAQNGHTDFDKVGKYSAEYTYADYNGNGGVAAKVKENRGFTDETGGSGGNAGDGFPDGAVDTDGDGFPDEPGTANPNDLIIYGGKFNGPAGQQNVTIDFYTMGYTGTAEVYCGIVPIQGNHYNAANPLPYNQFSNTALGSFGPGSHLGIPVQLPDNVTIYRIWLVFMKDGRISNRIAINAGGGSLNPDYVWGEEGRLIVTGLPDAANITARVITGTSSLLNQTDLSNAATLAAMGAGPALGTPLYEPNGSIFSETGSYHVVVSYGTEVKYKTGVPFNVGSAAVDWRDLIPSTGLPDGTGAPGSGSGTLTVTGNISGTVYALVVNGAISIQSDLDTASYVAAIGIGPVSGVPLYETTGPGFSKTGNFTVVVKKGEEVKYRNGVSFTNGSATVNWDSDLIILPEVIGPPIPPAGAAIYVRFNGNDITGDGSQGNPLRSLSLAVNMADQTTHRTVIVDGTLNAGYDHTDWLASKNSFHIGTKKAVITNALSGQIIIKGINTGTLVAAPDSRVLFLAPGANIKIEDLVITGGDVNIYYGGGILLYGNARLILGSGSVVENNRAPLAGGGVELYGTGLDEKYKPYLQLDGGVIRNNTVVGSTGYGGGGVSIFYGTMRMNSGAIYNNESKGYGGGVHIYDCAVFDMYGGDIHHNNASLYSGGGVYIGALAEFNLYDGEIYSNTTTAPTYGYGGGVARYDGSSAIFNKQGGTIYGKDDGAKSNTSARGYSHAYSNMLIPHNTYTNNFENNTIRSAYYRNGLVSPLAKK
jgi:hypothetical protein